MMSTEQLLNLWLVKNLAAVDEAAKYLSKKGEFNPKLEKPWPVWEKLRTEADLAWYAYRKQLLSEQYIQKQSLTQI